MLVNCRAMMRLLTLVLFLLGFSDHWRTLVRGRVMRGGLLEKGN